MIQDSIYEEAVRNRDYWKGRATEAEGEVAAARRREQEPISTQPYQIGGDRWPGLAKLLEEMGEVLEVAGKLMQIGGSTDHWTGDLRERLRQEIADLDAALWFFTTRSFEPVERKKIERRSAEKRDLFEEWEETAWQRRQERQERVWQEWRERGGEKDG